jgi:hypothetical protein
MVHIGWRRADDNRKMLANSKTNEAVHPQKMHRSSLGQNYAGSGADYYYSSPHRIEPKPSTGGVTQHGLWMTPVRLVGVPSGHMHWWGKKPPATMVCLK